MNRRVQQLEFLDTQAVRWRVSVDFEVDLRRPPDELPDARTYFRS